MEILTSDIGRIGHNLALDMMDHNRTGYDVFGAARKQADGFGPIGFL